ncbi:MAG: 5'-deoxynucleotidase [Eubacterium sp.]|jgi:5'-deoxynucleotidase|nr:5'-deoxynucleotidase [Eubacterium sp.]MCI9617313.1 5'-deoxynucleotidase [Eubacterium sp.]
MNNFFGMLARMKYINRWGLMRNTNNENIAEHSLQVAIIAHALAVIGNVRLKKNLNAEHIAMMGIMHDTSEIITGDLPTPIKYYAPEIRDAYKKVEYIAANQLLSEIPEDMRDAYRDILIEDESEEWKYVKAADKLSAYIKCMEEKNTGNTDFSKAETAIEQALEDMNMEEVRIFMDEFLSSYTMTLDEINKQN